jgi:hypothetical protein
MYLCEFVNIYVHTKRMIHVPANVDLYAKVICMGVSQFPCADRL